MHILWTGRSFQLARVVLRHDLAEAPHIAAVCEAAGVPVLHVHGQTPTARRGDLWVGTAPAAGWTPHVADIAWARAVEAPVVLAKLSEALEAARVPCTLTP